MDARTVLTRGLTTGLRLGRGVADRVVTVAGPRLARVTDKASSRLRRREPAATTTFTPSPATDPEVPKGPSPASVARNIGPARPTATPPAAAKARPAPGAKLPPRRTATS